MILQNPFRTLHRLTRILVLIGVKSPRSNLLFLSYLRLVTTYYTYPEHTPTIRPVEKSFVAFSYHSRVLPHNDLRLTVNFLLAAAGTPIWHFARFVLVPQTDAGVAQHRPSGMACMLRYGLRHRPIWG